MPDQKPLIPSNPRFIVHGPIKPGGAVVVRSEDGDVVLTCFDGTNPMYSFGSRHIHVSRRGNTIKVSGYGVDVVFSLTTGYEVTFGRIGP